MTARPRNYDLPLLSLHTHDQTYPKILANLKPLLEISAQVRRFAEEWEKSIQPFRENFERWAKHEEKCEMLVDAGWVPHWSSPYDVVQENHEDLDALVNRYYREDWDKIKDRIQKVHEDYFVDEQTADVLRQALLAHEGGLYRVNARLIFPEIERLARVYLHSNDINRTITSQRDLAELVGKSNPARLKAHGRHGYRLYRILAKHAYTKVDTVEKLAKISKSEIPNRHAALHGLLPYDSMKCSLNSIFIFDFVIGVTCMYRSLDANR